MKKKFWLFGVMAAVFAFSITGCGSSPNASPKAAAQEQTAAPDLTGVGSYYVRADGDDKNPGTSEAAPFKTLQRAVEAAAKTFVKKITVIGTIAGDTKIMDSGSAEILITGKVDGRETEKAFLRPPSAEVNAIIEIDGVSNIRIEHIIITGDGTTITRGIWVDNEESILALGQGTVVSGNGGNADRRMNVGGGILVSHGTLIMQGNAAVTGNYAGEGGGVAVGVGTFLMKDDARIAENTADDGREFNGGGGVLVADGATLTMEGNAVIESNQANSGGGVLLYGGALLMRGNAAIKNNTANTKRDSLLYGGGGIYSYESTITLQGGSSIAGNSAVYGGGVYLKVSELTQESENLSGNTAATEGPDTYENNH
jgi:hypothetical protein